MELKDIMQNILGQEKTHIRYCNTDIDYPEIQIKNNLSIIGWLPTNQRLSNHFRIPMRSVHGSVHFPVSDMIYGASSEIKPLLHDFQAIKELKDKIFDHAFESSEYFYRDLFKISIECLL